jgi:hypothetical protein
MIIGARRFDVGEISSVETSPQGYLRCDGRITRIGVFDYRDGKGGIRRELRLPKEVFHKDALESFALAPMTLGHPGEELSTKNTGKYQVGSVTGPRRDGDFVGARIQLTDEKAIASAKAGKRELSCGYKTDLEMISGVTSGIDGIPDGLRYDAIQRNIRGNHVALPDRGRAGREASLRLDHDDAEMIQEQDSNDLPKPRAGAPDQGATMTTKIKIDGVDYEVSESAAQAIAKEQGAFAELEAASAETAAALQTEKARADKAEEDLAAEKKAREDAEDPKRLREAIDARLDLERVAAMVLGDEVKLDELTDDEIRAQVVIKASKDAEKAEKALKDCEPAYLAARFDAAVEGFEPETETNEGLFRMRQVSKDAGRQDADEAQAAHDRMVERGRKAGREPIAS